MQALYVQPWHQARSPKPRAVASPSSRLRLTRNRCLLPNPSGRRSWVGCRCSRVKNLQLSFDIQVEHVVRRLVQDGGTVPTATSCALCTCAFTLSSSTDTANPSAKLVTGRDILAQARPRVFKQPRSLRTRSSSRLTCTHFPKARTRRLVGSNLNIPVRARRRRDKTSSACTEGVKLLTYYEILWHSFSTLITYASLCS